jgi:hypothetical protein
MVHDSAVRDDPVVRSPDIGAITPAMQQAIDAMVYACQKRGLRATSMDMRDALEAVLPYLLPLGQRVEIVLDEWGHNHYHGKLVSIELAPLE